MPGRLQDPVSARGLLGPGRQLWLWDELLRLLLPRRRPVPGGAAGAVQQRADGPRLRRLPSGLRLACGRLLPALRCSLPVALPLVAHPDPGPAAAARGCHHPGEPGPTRRSQHLHRLRDLWAAGRLPAVIGGRTSVLAQAAPVLSSAHL